MMKEKEKRSMMNNYLLLLFLGILFIITIGICIFVYNHMKLRINIKNILENERRRRLHPNHLPKDLLKPKNHSDDWVEN